MRMLIQPEPLQRQLTTEMSGKFQSNQISSRAIVNEFGCIWPWLALLFSSAAKIHQLRDFLAPTFAINNISFKNHNCVQSANAKKNLVWYMYLLRHGFYVGGGALSYSLT